MRFPNHYKLLSKAEYKEIFDHPYKITQKYLLALFRPNQKPYGRLGLVIGKRTVNKAVNRNQIKRIIRESFRLNQEQLKGIDVIIIARHQCDTLNKAELRKGIDLLWQKLLTQYQSLSL